MTTKNLQVMFHVSRGWELPLVMTLTEPTLDYSTNGFISLFVLLTITYSSSLQCILVNYTLSYLVLVNRVAMYMSSSETQGQLVGTTGFSWAKVYNKSGRAPGHLLLPSEFQKRLKSRLLIGQKNIFLANQRRGTAGRLSCLLTRGCFPHRTP